MTQLVAFLSTGKDTWSHVVKLMSVESWENVILLTNEFGKQHFRPDKNMQPVAFDERKDTVALKKELYRLLSDKITDIEVAVNMYSGSGKEHMALFGALQELGVGMRLVTVEDGSLHIL